LGDDIVFIYQRFGALRANKRGAVRYGDMLLLFGILAILEINTSSPSDSHIDSPFSSFVGDAF